VLNPIAWLHAAIVTRRARYLALAIVYVVPIVIGAMIQSAHPKSSSAGGGWYAISWLVCMVQVAVARKRVAEEAWMRKGQVRCGEHPSAREAGQGRLGRHQNFEDTVADYLAAGERLIASVPRVSLDAGFRREHGLYSRGFPQDAVAVTDRRVLVISLKRRRFTIVESFPRADARVTEYEPKRRDGESLRDHVVIQASDTTVKFSVAPSIDRGAELIAALGGVVEPTSTECAQVVIPRALTASTHQAGRWDHPADSRDLLDNSPSSPGDDAVTEPGGLSDRAAPEKAGGDSSARATSHGDHLMGMAFVAVRVAFVGWMILALGVFVFCLGAIPGIWLQDAVHGGKSSPDWWAVSGGATALLLAITLTFVRMRRTHTRGEP
jgi:hypothetical protein